MGTRDLSNKKGGTVLNEKTSVRSLEVAIDYPQNGAVVMPGHFAVRVSGAPEANVEVSINEGTWQPCRPAVGYYWCDWWAEPGQATLVARFKVGDNEWKKSKERRTVVSDAGRN